MAAKEPYDYLSAVTPDYTTTTLAITPHGDLTERVDKRIRIYEADDASEERVALSNSSLFTFDLQWNYLSAADAGTIIDFYCDATKANGRGRSFKYTHVDGHTYCVRFDCEMPRALRIGNFYSISGIKLKVLGKI